MTPTALNAAEALCQFLVRERAEPAQTHETDLLALCAHFADGDLNRHRERAHAQQNHIGIFGHVLFEERVGAVVAAENPVHIRVHLAQHILGALGDTLLLQTDLHHPVFVALRGDRDSVVRMEQQVAAIVARQELIDLRLRRDLHQ